jgi:hypothetical protein
MESPLRMISQRARIVPTKEPDVVAELKAKVDVPAEVRAQIEAVNEGNQ